MMLTRQQVQARFQISKSSLYRLMRAGLFPEPVQVGIRAVRWDEAEVASWLASRPRSHGDGIHRASQLNRRRAGAAP